MSERIKEHRDFCRLYRNGKSFVARDVVVYLAPNRRNKLRVGVAVGKKIGGAVRRNRAKRVLRAAFFALEEAVAPGYDILLVARSVTPDRKSGEVCASLQELLKSAGVFL